MNSMISYSKLAAAALCGVLLVACNAVQDVTSKPTYPLPTQGVVVTGTVTGVPLSTTRPVVLEDDGQQRCPPPGSATDYTGPLVYCTYTVAGTSVLRFGSLPVGAPYNIVVKSNPLGRICTISNGTGVANAQVTNVTLNCVRDSTPMYTVTATIAPAIATALPTGFKVTLTTEEGTETISPTAGQSQVVFTKPVLNSGSQLPAFAYVVSATTELTPGVVSNCAVTGATNVAAAGTVVPTGNVSVTVSACQFTIGGTVTYSQPPQTAYTPQTISGLQLGLRYQATGAIVDTVNVTAFTPATAAATSPFTFPIKRDNNSQGLYDVTVTTQPTGQFCEVDGGGIAPLVVLSAWVTSTANNPATQPANITNIAVRCRNLPVVANQLSGTYQVVGQNSTLTTVGTAPAPNSAVATTMGSLNPGALGFGTTQTTAITSVNPAGTVATTTASDDRRFLTFFNNGTFLYGVHSGSANTTTGLEYGFYSYDSVAQTIYYTITTDNNGTTANSIASGISGTPGQCTVVPAAINFAQGAVVSASDAAFNNANFKTTYLGIPAANTAALFSSPFWINTGTTPNPPPATYAFNGKATGTWSAAQNLGGSYWYQLLSITITDPAGFSQPQVYTLPATCPTATAPVMTTS